MTDTTSVPRLSPATLEAFACGLFERAGMDADKAASVARLLVQTDTLGRRTHGLAMAPLYLADMARACGVERARQHGVACLAIRRSHHIGSLATLVRLATEQGCIAWISNSEPAARRVAPYGGREALFTPNPMAFGWPADDHPVLIDLCASITTTSMTRQLHARG
ncbi:MAG: hypothetical protein RL223_4678, partial [Pseudomonadota bacterium]